MGIFRSEEVLHKKIRIPTESSLEVMDALGKMEIGSIEFIDLNKNDIDAKKVFANMMKRCDEMDRKLSNFELFAQEFKQNVHKYNQYRQFLVDLDCDINRRQRHEGVYFDIIESEIIEEERKIIELIDLQTKIKENLEILIEKKYVLDKSNQLISENSEYNSVYLGSPCNQMIIEEGHQNAGLNFIAGVSKADDELKMKRMIFRASKGRAIVTFFDFFNTDVINSQDTYNKFPKKIFTIFYQGGVENILLSKILRICDLFGVSRYTIPKREEIRTHITNLQSEIQEKRNFLRETEISIKNYLKNKLGSDNQPSLYDMYRLYFKKEKMIYSNLSKCIFRDNFIDGEVWILKKEFPNVKQVIKDLDKDDIKMPTIFTDPELPSGYRPTHIPTNEFIYPFQKIVDTYGIPAYKEINPAYFNIVTFPFLFGMMFGDIGHGFLLFIFGLYICLHSDKIRENNNSLLKSFIKVRYLLLLMGFFAFYCGFIYNDFLSLPLPIFKTCYMRSNDSTPPHAVKISKDCVYPVGLDPQWRSSSNELTFTNSYKMKISVIVGVIHMTFGILLKGLNEIYFDRKVRFFLEFIPQLFFMIGLFGYMIVLIFIKWGTDWTGRTHDAPSLISQMLSIFLSFGNVNEKPLWEDKSENSRYFQETLHIIILIVCVVLIPFMLIPKPIIIYFQQKKIDKYQRSGFDKLSDEMKIIVDNSYQSYNHEFIHEEQTHQHHSFSELFVHSAIETIEFVLGTISNTASYLRLWALSLAHGELSKVFFEKTILDPITDSNNIFYGIIRIFVGFIVFANASFFVLMCMDMLECFLHTLRLHWVEFQSKFFKADGYKFNPYSFKTILEV